MASFIKRGARIISADLVFATNYDSSQHDTTGDIVLMGNYYLY
jgi:hypothetical protein